MASADDHVGMPSLASEITAAENASKNEELVSRDVEGGDELPLISGMFLSNSFPGLHDCVASF